MQYAFLGCLVPNELEEKVKFLSSNNMQDAANALQWHIYNGLCRNLKKDIKIFNILPIGSFPQYYKKAFVKKEKFETEFCKDNINIGFCNIKLIRQYYQSKEVYKTLLEWCKSSNDEKFLFVYTISSCFVKAISKVKKFFPSLKVCAIVADLPDMTCLKEKKGIFHKILINKNSSYVYKEIDVLDCFVLLTSQMADYLKINKPFCVMEGISTDFSKISNDSIMDNTEKIILYSGTLHKKFGIMNLVNAFKMIDNPEYRLIICGIGDSISKVEEAAKKDKRIIYKGQLERSDVLLLQQKATVLVNPRQNNEEFTKYSFPSKNLEYLSSGIPVIAYKLDGIPDEYEDYIYYVEDNEVLTLTNKLIEICEMDANVRKLKANLAQKFVVNEKNEIRQTDKIIKNLKKWGFI